MRGLRLASLLTLLVLIPGQESAVEAGAQQSPIMEAPSPHRVITAPASSARHDVTTLRIPGGGRILFLPGQGVGVVDADGSVSEFGKWTAVEAFWDPMHPGHVLVDPMRERERRILEFRRTDHGWEPVRNWPTGYGPYAQ